MYSLTSTQDKGIRLLIKWVNDKSIHWGLTVIVNRNQPHFHGGIEKRQLSKEQVIMMLETILFKNYYIEGDKMYLNRLRYLWEFDKKHKLTENDIK